MLGAVILQVILILMNAIFACAEIAVISTNEAKLEKLSEKGDKKAKKLLALTQNPSKFLSTIQVAITFAGFLGSAFASDSFAGPLVEWLLGLGVKIPADTLNSICVFVITIVLSFFSIVCGELVPKRIAMKHAESMALGLSGPLRFVSFIFAPFVWLLTAATNGLLRLFHINPDEQNDEVTEEEIRLMIDTGNEKGAIDNMEKEMIQNIFEFDDISISEVCTHRRNVTLLYQEDDLEEWKRIISESRHTYYPICDEDADSVVGILSIKKFYRSECGSTAEVIETLAEKPYFVPENMKADVLFNNMKETRNYFAVVMDEYGGMSGVITIHDLLELLVGDLGEKDEERVEQIENIGENEWKIVGSASLVDVAAELDVEFDEEECDTFGGYIFGLLGEVPDDGATFEVETDDLHIRVELVESHRIEQTVVTKKEKITEDEENEDSDSDDYDDDDTDDKDKDKKDKRDKKD